MDEKSISLEAEGCVPWKDMVVVHHTDHGWVSYNHKTGELFLDFAQVTDEEVYHMLRLLKEVYVQQPQ